MSDEEGCGDGMCTEARLSQPGRLLETRQGVIHMVDTGNHRIVSIDPQSGAALTTHAGTGHAGFLNGPGDHAQFCSPSDLVEYPENGSLVVCDTQNHALRLISPDRRVTTFAGIFTVVYVCAFLA